MDYQPKPLGDKSLHFNVGRLAFFHGLRKMAPYEKREKHKIEEWEAGWLFAAEEKIKRET